MTDFLTELGTRAWDPFWLPILIWSALGLAAVLFLRVIPGRQIRLHVDVRVALLLALPLGLIIANLIPAASSNAGFVLIVPAPAVSGIPSNQVAASMPVVGFYTIIGAITLLALVSAFVGLGRFASSYYRLSRLIRAAVPLESTPVVQESGSNRRSIDVLESADIPVAFSSGIVRKKIVIPADDEPEKLLVISHELMHHEHGDVLRATISRTIVSLFFFHPLVHLLCRQIRLYVELSCDQRVLARTGVERKQYALLLLKYAGQPGFPAGPTLTMADTRSHLSRRIHAMKNPILMALGPKSVLSIAAVVLSTAVFVAACTESALVAPAENGIEESDVLARTMQLPAATVSEAFVIVESMPELIGGLQGLQDRLQYPVIAELAGIHGRVFLQFYVQPDGRTSDIVVTRGIGGGCDEEAVRIVREARFIPGVQAGKRVPVKMSLPITFSTSPTESSKPVDVDVVMGQIEAGSYKFSRETWNAVASAYVDGTIVDHSGDPVTEAKIYFPRFDITFGIRGAARYTLALPAGTWTAIVKTPDAEWEETFVLSANDRKVRDLREPVK